MINRLRVAVAGIVMAAALSGPGLAQNSQNAVVAELYTSQGCSSCPPADAILGELAGRDDVIALALHVDYWDYIGWEDSFAAPEFTARQRNLARAGGRRMVYTPQMIVSGQGHLVGSEISEISAALAEAGAAAPGLELTLTRQQGRVAISAPAISGPNARYVVQLVRYIPSQRVEIRSGENRGRDITYSNIVTSWEVLREWSGRAPLSFRANAPGDQPIVVIVQRAGHGPIVGAARLR